jgi:hypothetical protein
MNILGIIIVGVLIFRHRIQLFIFHYLTNIKSTQKKLNDIFFHSSNYDNMYGGSINLHAHVIVHHNFGKKQTM